MPANVQGQASCTATPEITLDMNLCIVRTPTRIHAALTRLHIGMHGLPMNLVLTPVPPWQA